MCARFFANILALFFTLFVVVADGEAAIAFENTNSLLTQASGTTLTGNQGINNGTDRCAIIIVSWNDGNNGTDVSSVTYNTVAATPVTARVLMGAASATYIRMFRLVTLPAGGAAYSLVVTFSDGNAIQQAAVLSLWSGVDQTTPIRASSSTTFSGNTASNGIKALTVTSAVDDTVVTAILENVATPTVDVTRIQYAIISGTYYFSHAYGAGGSPSATHTWNTGSSGTNIIAMVGASLQPVQAPTGNPRAIHQFKFRRQ